MTAEGVFSESLGYEGEVVLVVEITGVHDTQPIRSRWPACLPAYRGQGTAVWARVWAPSSKANEAAKWKPPWGQVFGRTIPRGW